MSHISLLEKKGPKPCTVALRSTVVAWSSLLETYRCKQHHNVDNRAPMGLSRSSFSHSSRRSCLLIRRREDVAVTPVQDLRCGNLRTVLLLGPCTLRPSPAVPDASCATIVTYLLQCNVGLCVYGGSGPTAGHHQICKSYMCTSCAKRKTVTYVIRNKTSSELQWRPRHFAKAFRPQEPSGRKEALVPRRYTHIMCKCHK